MKRLRQYIRQVILETKQKDNRKKTMIEALGEKVFATSAPPGHPHHGDEKNTDIEDKFQEELWDYIVYNTTDDMSSDFGEKFAEYARDPRYAAIIKVAPRGTKLYRGMKVPREQLEWIIFGEDESRSMPAGKIKPETTYPIHEDYTQYEHYDWRPSANQPLSSWTSDPTSAAIFSSGGETMQDDDAEIPIVFIAKSGGKNYGKFLDFRELYAYAGLEPKKHEQEIAGWGLLELHSVYVGQF